MNMRETELICPYCGEITLIRRKRCNTKPIGYQEEMYCPKCKTDRKFIEIRDKDKCYYNLLYKQNLTDVEKLIFDLLKERREKNIYVK